MLHRLALLLGLVLLSLTGCSEDAAPTPERSAFSSDVRDNFLASCVENATATSQGAVSEEQLATTCECILGKVEQEYEEAEFRAFEQRLVDGSATEEENAQLEQWSSACAGQTG